MHRILNGDGSIKRVTMTQDEWNRIHPDYKGTGRERTALVLDDKRGTCLVSAQITPDGLPIPPKVAALPVRFPDWMVEQMRDKNPERFAERQGAAEAILRTQYAVPEFEGTDAAEQLAAFVILATEADALGSEVDA